MKSIIKQSGNKAGFTPLERKSHSLDVIKKPGSGLKSHRGFLTGFTIVELLTVMSIIIILFGLLVPSLNMVRRYAKKVKQNAQFHGIDAALQMFYNDFEGYPDSDRLDQANPQQQYPGAMKLAEAMVGQDLLGFHPDSLFMADGFDGTGVDLYRQLDLITRPDDVDNFRARQGPYLPVDAANAYTLEEIYSNIGTFTDPCSIVLCDEYPRARNTITGKRIGMPILYYKANISNTGHSLVTPLLNTYNHLDNLDLIDLGVPWDQNADHPMDSSALQPDGPVIFYDRTRNKKISIARPYRPQSYILLSAGFDGLYGTRDDVYNFTD